MEVFNFRFALLHNNSSAQFLIGVVTVSVADPRCPWVLASTYVEARARDPDEGWELFEWRQKLREEESKLILDELRDWAEGQPVLPRSPIGKAIKYLKARWPRLTRFVDDPELWLDNNPTERGIRGPVVGRKNHYGSRSRRGTEVAAMMYTIFETAKICGVDPRDYIRRVVINDIDNPHTVTLPKPIEDVMETVGD